MVLLEDRRGGPPDTGVVLRRRYRLARLRFDSRPAGSTDRFGYLKRTYE
jgi:hypothetical protein